MEEMIDAIGYHREWSTDPIHGYTTSGYSIFIPDPYLIIVNYGSDSPFSEKQLFVRKAIQPDKFQSPTIHRQNEPLEHENIKIPKKWAQSIIKISEKENELKELKKLADVYMPSIMKLEKPVVKQEISSFKNSDEDKTDNTNNNCSMM